MDSSYQSMTYNAQAKCEDLAKQLADVRSSLDRAVAAIAKAGYSADDHGGPDLADCIERLVNRFVASEAARIKIEAELRMVDESLARRPAIADAPDRATAIYRACSRASQADKIEREAAAMRAVLERQRCAYPGCSDARDAALASTAGQCIQRQLEVGERLRDFIAGSHAGLSNTRNNEIKNLIAEFDAAKKGGA